MDLYDCIEKTRFLGREFLVWIWWKSELLDGKMEIPDFGPSEVWLDDQLILEARGESVEQSKLRGVAPSATPEAREALRQGKVPTKAKISISRDEQEFSFVLEGETFALAGVKTPALLQEDVDERFYERMYLLEQTEAMLYALYDEFLLLRLSPQWMTVVAPAIRDWIREEKLMRPDDYHGLVAQVKASQPRTKRKAAPRTSAAPSGQSRTEELPPLEPWQEPDPEEPPPLEPWQEPNQEDGTDFSEALEQPEDTFAAR